MAQGVLASATFPLNGVGSSLGTSLTAEELREILEYDRIVQFRDAVLAGTHPRVKIPPHLVGKPVVPSLDILSSSLSILQSSAPLQPPQSTPKFHVEDSLNLFSRKSPTTHRPSVGASKSEINPILLEKSDDLIKAEIQLQRQRLERGLREQIEQQRIAAKAALQTFESLPDFDLSEVLSKALAIVQSSAPVEVAAFVGARSSASDSFDERTFYSSQHDTPESSSSQGQKEFSELQSRAAISPSNRQSELRSVGYTGNRVGEGDVALSSASNFINSAAAHGANSQLATSSNAQQAIVLQRQEPSSGNSSSSDSRRDVAVTGASGSVSQSSTKQRSPPQLFTSPRQMASQTAVQRTNQELLSRAFDNSRASPLIRAHNLSPHAPQPARVSSLATAREPHVLQENRQNEGAPTAQVAALRHLASGLSSTDSSPKAGSMSERKKKQKERKEKKRKARHNGPASPDSPYIKPEPQSPEPFAVAPLPRPQKRQRHSGQFASGLSYDEPEVIQGYSEPQRMMRPRAYQRNEDRYEVERTRVEPTYHRMDDDYRPNEVQYLSGPPAGPHTYPQPDTRSVRATSIMERRTVDEPRYYREQISRASARPDMDRERSRSPILREARSPVPMAPPRKPMRIVIDEFGNEYLEPAPGPATRQFMAPPARYREPEVIYERAPVRSVSARAPAEAYEEGGVIYRRASPSLARRVVTQPEYMTAQPEYRSYRQREYSTRTSAPGEDFVQMRAPERRPVAYYEEPIRDLTRAPSTRPEAIRYELPREYAGRVQSIRPEGAPREYAASVHPDSRRDFPLPPREYSIRPEGPPREYASSVRPDIRREVISQGQREYSVRPVETMQRREYLPIPGDGYYEERRPAEVSFIERPRAREASVVVYADDVRREVYR